MLGRFPASMGLHRGCCRSSLLLYQASSATNIPVLFGRYYALIMTCIFYRKVMWLNNACMAAVWLFPAVTALHAIIIASVHVNGKSLYKTDISPKLTCISDRCCRYGHLRIFPNMFNGSPERPGNVQAVPDIL